MFQRLRKIVFWAHLATGIAAGIFILLMALTGVLISYERQITEAVQVYAAPVEPASRRMTPEELLTALQAATPGPAPTAMTLEADPGKPVAFAFGREKTLYVDPSTGALLGEGARKTRSFFQFVTTLHRWLALEGKGRDVGRSLTAAAALVFFFIIPSGLLLWIPKRWTKKGVKAITTFQFQLKGRARNWNWHNVLGIWSALPLLLICSTGLVMAYPWAAGLLFRAAGEAPPQAGGPEGERRGGPGGPAKWPESTAGWNDAFAVAMQVSKEWKTIQFQFPRDKKAVFQISDSHRGRPDLRQAVTVDLASGMTAKVEKFEDQGKGKQWRAWTRWIHTGEAGGWIGQTIAALSAASAVVLVWTGFALSWRRLRTFRQRSS